MYRNGTCNASDRAFAQPQPSLGLLVDLLGRDGLRIHGPLRAAFAVPLLLVLRGAVLVLLAPLLQRLPHVDILLVLFLVCCFFEEHLHRLLVLSAGFGSVLSVSRVLVPHADLLRTREHFGKEQRGLLLRASLRTREHVGKEQRGFLLRAVLKMRWQWQTLRQEHLPEGLCSLQPLLEAAVAAEEAVKGLAADILHGLSERPPTLLRVVVQIQDTATSASARDTADAVEVANNIP
mmetsp:Transcript_66562/g.184287  ORF Transcript_66562/g.184287 Transcript_66562/m.184287 type:complete len:235 (-) Transcript_66562:1035-1739(-)